jgi:hypothetical protein
MHSVVHHTTIYDMKQVFYKNFLKVNFDNLKNLNLAFCWSQI